MKSMVEIWNLTVMEIKRRFISIRFLLGIVITFCAVFLNHSALNDYLKRKEFKITALEMYPFTLYHTYFYLVLILIYVFFMCDVPFYHDGMDHEIIRTDWRNWLFARLLVIIGITAIWLLSIWFDIVAIHRGYIVWSNEWSTYVKMAARASGSGAYMIPSFDLCEFLSPIAAWITTFILNLFAYSLLSLAMMAVNIRFKGNFGIVCAVLFVGLRFLNRVVWSSEMLRILSPLDLIDLTYGGYRIARVAYAIVYLSVFSAILLLLNHTLLRKYGLQMKGQEG